MRVTIFEQGSRIMANLPLVRARSRGLIVASLAALLLAGCASEAIIPLPPEKPVIKNTRNQLDPDTAREHRRLLAAFGGEYRNASAQAVLDDTLTKLAPATERPDLRYRVTILNSASVNAFALPNGSIYVTRGLLALANSTSELGSVLAHEMAHVTANHAIERAQLERRATLVSRVNSDLLNDTRTGQTRQDEGRVAIASFSRQQELDADQIGVRTVAKVGYDPYGATRFLNSLGRSAVLRGKNSKSGGIEFLATHPSTPERIAAALAAARQLSAASNVTPEKEQLDHNRYVTAMNGVTFGDDPADGIVRNNRFLHPRLGFTFEAPDGFRLENSSLAVLGLKGDGQQALRFESIKLGQEASLQDYLKSSPIQGAPTSRIEALAISGFEGATAIANSDDWTYRFAVIRNGDRAYRMILAAQSFTPEVDRQFRVSLESFRSLTGEEVKDLRIEKIAIITAQAGDSASTLAARMTGEQALERFMVLNGLNSADDVRAGTRYKIIS